MAKSPPIKTNSTSIHTAQDRREREWFELVARQLESIAAEAGGQRRGRQQLQEIGSLIPRMLQAAGYLRYKLVPLVAIAFTRVALGSKDKGLSPGVRRYLRTLVEDGLIEIHAQAIAPKPSGPDRRLSLYEERRLTRAYFGLVRFFQRRKRPRPRLSDVNAQIEAFYPDASYPGRKLTANNLVEILRRRSARQRAMTALAILLPLGQKAIQQRCYAAERSQRGARTS